MKPLHYLVYTSIISSHCTSEQIEQILETSRTNNQELDITGILVHTERHFMQYLEGPASHIISIFNKIKMDDRHHDVILCYFTAIDERLFPSWQMAYKDLENNTLALKHGIQEEERLAFEKALGDNLREECFGSSQNILDLLKIFL